MYGEEIEVAYARNLIPHILISVSYEYFLGYGD